MKVACVQINSGDDVQANLARVDAFLKQASEQSVQLVLLPENFAQMPASSNNRHIEVWQPAQADEHAPVQQYIQAAAKRYNLTIVAGSLPILPVESSPSQVLNRPFARSFVVDPNEGLLAHYDKLHLFDVDTGEARYCESDDFCAGSLEQLSGQPPSNLVKLGDENQSLMLGLSICYDLRFPELYREMLNQGAQVFTIPAAFTYETGERHWQVLLQARAIENQSYILAAGQCGAQQTSSTATRKTWGHSMVVAPNGDIIASLKHEEGLLIADIDLIQQKSIRERFPVLNHQRLREQ